MAASSVSPRKLLVSAATRRVPEFVRQLAEWQYMERTIHRLLCAWGRHHSAIEDKAALHRHVWDQAEVIRRLRERIEQFPGGKADAPVHPQFAKLTSVALHAPDFEDALDAIYYHLPQALVRAYVAHVQAAHPVHDAPSIALLHEINTIKEQHCFWFREYRRRHPHTTDAAYRRAMEKEIASLHSFLHPMPPHQGPGAMLCGAGEDFSLPRHAARPDDWRPRYNIMPYLSADFRESVEARRLFWGIGYFWEMNLADDQLRWLYYGDQMPWEWHHDVSRHLWDESRHGLSGYSRLQDWGLTVADVGYPPYDQSDCLRTGPEGSPALTDPFLELPSTHLLSPGSPLSAQGLYEAVFFIGMVAENGHFIVKNESYDDFREGQDYESAEMMLFDIIDETKHVQYAHRWLPMLAEQAGLDNTDYRQRAARERRQRQEEENQRIAEAGKLPREKGFAPWDHYQDLLRRVRKAAPFPKKFHPPIRSPKPM